MSKLIKITKEYITELCQEFEKSLYGFKASDGKINYTKTLPQSDRKARLIFTETAWIKMTALVGNFDKEVAWHGLAFRGNEGTDDYYISDILVYPQEVTGATVNTDQKQYEMWLMQHDDDVFNNIRMQGHSHVNMNTSPSGVDLTHQEKILEQLEDDMFYIFVIWNKKGEKTIKIFDFKKNILFETSDVTVSVLDNEIGLEKFIADAKKMVQEKKYTSTSTYTIPATNYTYYGGTSSSTKSQNKTNEKKDNTEEKPKKGKRKERNRRHGGYGGLFDDVD